MSNLGFLEGVDLERLKVHIGDSTMLDLIESQGVEYARHIYPLSIAGAENIMKAPFEKLPLISPFSTFIQGLVRYRLEVG